MKDDDMAYFVQAIASTLVRDYVVDADAIAHIVADIYNRGVEECNENTNEQSVSTKQEDIC